MSIIKADNLSKVYKVSEDVETIALEKVSFNIEKGEYVAIMGPSGSGKSTLMHILGALDTPSSGEYILDGKKVSNLTDDELAEIRNKKIGFVFQAYNLLPRTTALRNVMVPMMYGNVPKAKREQKAKELLELVGLGDRLYHHSNQLSGGQQQRVAIARALSMDPAIILADEPTGNISGKHVEEIMKTFNDLNKKGHTIIIITHEKDIADMTKRIIFLKDGHLVEDRRKRKNKI
ncbi:ABC transporter ATP-binding protein [Candidatus Beckwithbacteria bacterium]|nr:ABC transporter ATP-binding protein [Candidatus Beckwithbacteria bacterium]